MIKSHLKDPCQIISIKDKESIFKCYNQPYTALTKPDLVRTADLLFSHCFFLVDFLNIFFLSVEPRRKLIVTK